MVLLDSNYVNIIITLSISIFSMNFMITTFVMRVQIYTAFSISQTLIIKKNFIYFGKEISSYNILKKN